MENASKALIIAGAVLLSVMIVSLLVYTGKSFGIIAKAEQDAKLTQDKKNFNLQYEVYDKTLMYGTDVLSCLNKAQSNNQKYVNQNYYGTENLGPEYRQEYLINVNVTLKKTIKEKITVYVLDSSGKKRALTTGVEATPATKMFGNNHFVIPKLDWYYFKDGKVKKGESNDNSYVQKLWKIPGTVNYNLMTTEIETKLTNGTYSLLNEANDNNIGMLSALLSTATEVEQTISNREAYGSQTTTGSISTDWYSATWKTAAYDFKTRKFKCTGITYNTETGYVSEINFEEVLPYE